MIECSEIRAKRSMRLREHTSLANLVVPQFRGKGYHNIGHISRPAYLTPQSSILVQSSFSALLAQGSCRTPSIQGSSSVYSDI